MIKNCVYCGKEFITNIPHKKYCSELCSSREHELNRPKREYFIKCSNCDKIFKASRNRTEKEPLRFCSAKCRCDYAKKYSIIKKCIICGKEFQQLKANHLCCSRECKDKATNQKKERTCLVCGKKYFSQNNNVMTCSDECYKKLKADIIIKNLKKGVYSHINSKPQIIINNYLDSIGVKYINEYQIERFSIDNYIVDMNKCIEIMGGYWHCDVRRFADNLSNIQKDRIKKDCRKHQSIINSGKQVLYLWEIDILNNFNTCKLLISEFLQKDNLSSYHSSDYIIENNTLKYFPNYIPQHLQMQHTNND